MAKYANILILLNSSDDQITTVKDFITSVGAKVEALDNALFIETTSQANTKMIINYITMANYTYLWYHNRIATGSAVVSQEINTETVERIKKIMLE